jgi:hypothetical protein
MMNLLVIWIQGEDFLGREVEFDPRRFAPKSKRALVMDPTFDASLCSGILVSFESDRFARDLYARAFIYPRGDFLESIDEEPFVDELRSDNCEV